MNALLKKLIKGVVRILIALRLRNTLILGLIGGVFGLVASLWTSNCAIPLALVTLMYTGLIRQIQLRHGSQYEFNYWWTWWWGAFEIALFGSATVEVIFAMVVVGDWNEVNRIMASLLAGTIMLLFFTVKCLIVLGVVGLLMEMEA